MTMVTRLACCSTVPCSHSDANTALRNTAVLCCTQTLRDIYHSEFGLGGLLQVAELAWQQGEDVYSSGGHALAAAMELHARIIRAGTAALARGSPNAENVTLPAGFDVLANMPPPPAGCVWSFNLRTQASAAACRGAPEAAAAMHACKRQLRRLHALTPPCALHNLAHAPDAAVVGVQRDHARMGG